MLGNYSCSKKIGTKRGRTEEKDYEGETPGREKRIKEESDCEGETSSREEIIKEASTLKMTNKWSAAEKTLFAELLAAYSRRDEEVESQLTTYDYWSPVFWQELCHVYNGKAANSQLPDLRPYELIFLGQALQLEFCNQRSMGQSMISEVLKSIFLTCGDCQRKVPVFPASVLPHLDYVAPASGGVSASGPRHEVAGVSVENAGQARSAQPVIRQIFKFLNDGDIAYSEAISIIEKVNLWFKDNHVVWITLLLDEDLAPAHMLGLLKESPAP